MKFVKIFALILLVFVFALKIQAQNFIVSGYVSDSLNHERLIGTHSWNEKSKTGTSSNAFGYFSLPLNKQSETPVILKISYIGYASKIVKISSDTILNIRQNHI